MTAPACGAVIANSHVRWDRIRVLRADDRWLIHGRGQSTGQVEVMESNAQVLPYSACACTIRCEPLQCAAPELPRSDPRTGGCLPSSMRRPTQWSRPRPTEGKIVWVNMRAGQLFGYSREELIGQSMDMLVPETSAPHTPSTAGIRDRSRAAADGRGHAARRPPQGRQRVPRRDLPARRSPRTRARSSCAAIRDVTEWMRAEAKFRGLLEAAPDAIDRRRTRRPHQSRERPGRARSSATRATELLGDPVEFLVPSTARAIPPDRRDRVLRQTIDRPTGAGMRARRPPQGRHRVPRRDLLGSVEHDADVDRDAARSATSPTASRPNASASACSARGTSRNACERSATSRSGWRASASSPAASPTTSTTCWR